MNLKNSSEENFDSSLLFWSSTNNFSQLKTNITQPRIFVTANYLALWRKLYFAISQPRCKLNFIVEMRKILTYTEDDSPFRVYHNLPSFISVLITGNKKKFIKKHLVTSFAGRRHSLFKDSHALLGQKKNFSHISLDFSWRKNEKEKITIVHSGCT